MSLLTTEKTNLLEGRLDEISTLQEERNQLLPELDQLQSGLDHQELNHLKELGKSNNALYDSALRGLAAARARVDGWLEAKEGLKTYTPDHKHVSSDQPTHKHEKRA